VIRRGNVNRAHIATLKGDMEREKAVIGAFITLKEPTKPMITEAASAGFYEPEYFPRHHYPRLQILTVKELLKGKKLEYVQMAESTFKKAERKRKIGIKDQWNLF
jgi:site-specific DNA-methyltransferase (adenine-specific)